MGIIDRIWNKLGGGETKAGPSGELRAGATRTLRLPGGAKMEMVWCPPGRFMMGSPEDEKGHRDSEKLHPVTLAEGFWMAKFPVTQKQWKIVMGGNPSHFRGSRLPVEHVSLFDCMEFCKKTGLSLPTEEQWEYACRAGSTGPYGGTGDLKTMGWNYKLEDCHSTKPVGRKAPNAWGLYDMHGNVWEWCLDVLDREKPTGVVDSCVPCSIRGGSVWDRPKDCRSASRGGEESGYHEESFGEPIRLIGFRPVAKPSEAGGAATHGCEE